MAEARVRPVLPGPEQGFRPPLRCVLLWVVVRLPPSARNLAASDADDAACLDDACPREAQPSALQGLAAAAGPSGPRGVLLLPTQSPDCSPLL